MSSTSPPPEAQRYGRSQTPESPRPVHIPEPSNIPVLLNQMDPVFNDTATYNISDDQTLSPLPNSDAEHTLQKPSVDEHDAVQSFFREAENQAAAESDVTNVQSTVADTHPPNQIAFFPSVSILQNDAAAQSAVPLDPSIPQKQPAQAQDVPQLGDMRSTDQAASEAPAQGNHVQVNLAEDELKVPNSQPTVSTDETMTNANKDKDGVDYQSLLDNITQSASAPPAAEPVAAQATTQEAVSSSATLPPVPGLPPKPPPQEHPVDFPSYLYPGNAQQPQQQQQSVLQGSVHTSNDDLSQEVQNTIPALATEQHVSDTMMAFNDQAVSSNGYPPSLPPQLQTGLAPGQTASQATSDAQRNAELVERPWSPRTQGLYDQFLEEERRYVTEGIWDKFPLGSRLFVGNLPSEKVTKRDLFHKFHRHGKLAQISIKQAYGFVQFLEASSCLNALNAEQGVEIRGRKVHLEISKPQKNTRGAGSKSNQAQPRRRSRSPERNNRRGHGDYREDSGRRSTDYRNRRSPSPRGYRNRDEFRPSPRSDRPRSPIYPPNYTTPQSSYDDEANLPLPRRDPRSAPDVQLLVLEPEVVQSFINWVEQGFRMKGLQASTIWLNPRLPLAAVIKRQIIEGVQAVVKLTRMAQSNSKIPLQVFDRTAGASNVNFNEYVDLDLNVAADIVLQARMRERAPSQPLRPPAYPPQPGYPFANQYGQTQPPANQFPTPIPSHFQSPSTQQYSYNTQPSNYSSPGAANTQPPNLQQLLANLRQPSGQPPAPPTPSTQALNGVAGSLPGQNQFAPNTAVQHAYGQYGSPPAVGFPPPPQPSHQSQPNVQNIMEQLARYQR